MLASAHSSSRKRVGLFGARIEGLLSRCGGCYRQANRMNTVNQRMTPNMTVSPEVRKVKHERRQCDLLAFAIEPPPSRQVQVIRKKASGMQSPTNAMCLWPFNFFDH